MKKIKSIILAAGEGKRMNSDLPKVMHTIHSKPMINYVIDCAKSLYIDDIIVVIGHKAEIIKQNITDSTINFVTQKEQLGTGHAIKMAHNHLDFDGIVLILYGDTPLINPQTISNFIDFHVKNDNTVSVISTYVDNPTGYGRIIKNNNNFEKIVEHKDCDYDQLLIKEVNTGIYCFDAKALKESLFLLQNNNSQKEYYLTDTLQILSQKNYKINTFFVEDNSQFLGVNTKIDLHNICQIFKNNINKNLMQSGVTIIDSNNTYISKDCIIGKDTIIEPNVIIYGDCKIGENCYIGSGSKISNSVIENNVTIQNSYIENSNIKSFCSIGPFCHLRPNTVLEQHVKIGNFVEIKNSTLGTNSKASHLSYLGDCNIGKNVNIGCGSITVNYDGYHKHKTTIEDDCFIGCNSNLISPVNISKNSYIAAGSTITQDVPSNCLAIARSRQTNKLNWNKKNS